MKHRLVAAVATCLVVPAAFIIALAGRGGVSRRRDVLVAPRHALLPPPTTSGTVPTENPARHDLATYRRTIRELDATTTTTRPVPRALPETS